MSRSKLGLFIAAMLAVALGGILASRPGLASAEEGQGYNVCEVVMCFEPESQPPSTPSDSKPSGIHQALHNSMEDTSFFNTVVEGAVSSDGEKKLEGLVDGLVQLAVVVAHEVAYHDGLDTVIDFVEDPPAPVEEAADKYSEASKYGGLGTGSTY